MAEDAKAEDKEEGAKGSGKKNLIMMIIVAIVMLGVGGGGAYFFLKPDPKAEKHAKSEHGDEEHGDEEHDEEDEEEEEEEDDGHGGAGPTFVPLETFTVNLQPDPDERFLQVNITLQVKSAKTEAKVTAHMPAIRSRLLLLLGSKEANEISDLEGKEALIEEILETLHEPFKKHGRPLKIKDAFFTTFVIQ